MHKPGTHFQYNSMGSYTLSAIVTKVTGQTTLEYLKPRLFEPLGIENPEWASSPEGNSLGGYGLKLRTEDIAKFGQLYLQKGKWNGKQLIPREWVEQATSKQVPNEQESHSKIGIDWRQGYGFQFWRCTHNAFRGDGAGGQFIVVIPEQGCGRRDHRRHRQHAGRAQRHLGEAAPGVRRRGVARGCRRAGKVEAGDRPPGSPSGEEGKVIGTVLVGRGTDISAPSIPMNDTLPRRRKP